MAKQFRADNIGSLLRPPELLQARAAYREGKLQRDQLRDIEDRSILKGRLMIKRYWYFLLHGAIKPFCAVSVPSLNSPKISRKVLYDMTSLEDGI